MRARLPTRVHDAGSIVRPVRVFGGGRLSFCDALALPIFGGLGDLDLASLLVHVHELVLVTTILCTTAPLLAGGHAE